MAAPAWSELAGFACFLAFTLALTLSLVLFALLRQRGGSPARSASLPPRAPAYADYSSQADVVARLTRRFCPRCRTPLSADAPEGLCPACLLEGGFEGDAVAGSGNMVTSPAATSLTQSIEKL